jgi:hypothetical protein
MNVVPKQVSLPEQVTKVEKRGSSHAKHVYIFYIIIVIKFYPNSSAFLHP